MVYGTYNHSYWGESKPTNITGGPHIVGLIAYQHQRSQIAVLGVLRPSALLAAQGFDQGLCTVVGPGFRGS